METACKHKRNWGFTVHTQESTPGGQLGRYDKGNAGDRTSHCCSGHPRNQVSGWKHNGSAAWKWELSLTPEVEIVTTKKKTLLLETCHTQMAKSAHIKKTHLATQMWTTRVCSRKWAYSWFCIVVLFTSSGPITEQQKFQAHLEV